MNIEEFRDYCLAKPGTSEEAPFGPDVLVLKVMDKIFALTGIDTFDYINLKCEPKYAIQLREEYEGAIRPGYHMNKKLWNSVDTNGHVPDKKIKHLINHSYELVVSKLPKKVKEELSKFSGV
ncbi:MAG: MmcQ/YjbR family DNA-binding protein [Ekhidna sp.]|nr:MmcQ/YjbR family DNA-binding protein [Ekhidna sp.]